MCRTEKNTQLYVYKSANILQPVKAVSMSNYPCLFNFGNMYKNGCCRYSNYLQR